MKAALKIAEQTRTAAVSCSPELALAMGRTLAHDWDVLVLVPMATSGLDTLNAELERLSVSRAFDALRVIDARGLPADARPELLARMQGANRTVVLVDPPEGSVLSTLLCADADALLLLAHQDESRMDDVRSVLERCGRDKFVGSFLLSGDGR